MGHCLDMAKSYFSPTAGLIQDLLLLSSIFLLATALGMLIWLTLWDYQTAKKRRQALKGRDGLRVIP